MLHAELGEHLCHDGAAKSDPLCAKERSDQNQQSARVCLRARTDLLWHNICSQDGGRIL
jgi:hypothetical protein